MTSASLEQRDGLSMAAEECIEPTDAREIDLLVEAFQFYLK